VDELRPELDRNGPIGEVAGEDAPAGAWSRLEDEDAPAGLDQSAGGRQTGDAGADHEYVGVHPPFHAISYLRYLRLRRHRLTQ
jgi:hypothetical protein